MKRERITKAWIERLVLRLMAGVDVGRVLEEFKISTGEARQVLQGGTGRRVVKELRGMQALQRELMLGELLPKAAEALARQMGVEAKPELQVRGAVSVLGLAGKKAGKAEAPGAEAEAPAHMPRLKQEEIQAIVRESAEELEERDRDRFAS